MTTYTDTFGNTTLPPAEYGYSSLTITADQTVVWPYNSGGSSVPVSKIMDLSCASGNTLTLPDATQVSTGEDFLIRNVGANSLTVKDSTGTTIATVVSGAASYFYLTSNATAAGVFGVIAFGVGTSSADAASLVGYGIKAVGNTLNQSHPVLPTATGITIDATHRSKLVAFTGGADTLALTSAATLGDDFFCLVRNEGTGTLTINPASSELIDGLITMQLQPSESMMLICTGTQWYSVGYGRSTIYQFTQLTKDVSAGGTITLTSAEAANKLITFIGNPSGAVTVVVPAVVAVYYTYSAISTAHTITFKTASGSGVGIDQGARIIALCDGTNVLSAQSAVANSSLSLIDGAVANPSLYFATQTNTGLYKYGTNGLGITVDGVEVGHFDSAGLTGDVVNTPAGNIAAITVQGAINELDTEKLATAAIGTSVQAYSANLDEYAAVNPTAAGLALLEDADAAAQRATLGLGTAATKDTGIASGNVIVADASGFAIVGGLSASGVQGIGYSTGSGGTVTQAGAKTNSVTLNKPCGQITMNNAALATGASVQFGVINSVVASADAVTATINFSTGYNYSVMVYRTSAGAFYLNVKNESSGSLSDALVINFAIIKGANS